ncbi:hypothetical protein [Nitrosovibrio sp. Nv4]|uniref:hypothetical protein n=1 Tax=Nitrosovibrio sp. Nv4 TaxID=1945880 RepID=UPI00117DC731|nr:hypothetical protein [Nitrosovibrio sp. Nv4]
MASIFSSNVPLSHFPMALKAFESNEGLQAYMLFTNSGITPLCKIASSTMAAKFLLLTQNASSFLEIIELISFSSPDAKWF